MMRLIMLAVLGTIALLSTALGAGVAMDDSLTPGAIVSADPAVVCAPSYARSQRLYDTDRDAYWRTVHTVLDAYHVAFADRHGYQIDHRVPLCLGGGNDARNQWPQPLAEAHEKDDLEWAACIAPFP